MAACSGGERDDGASGLRRTNRASRTAGGPASPAGATRQQLAGAPSAPAVPPHALVGRVRGVAAGQAVARRSSASPATPGGRGWTVRSRSPGPRTRRRPATASPDRTTATRSTARGAGALSSPHCTRSPLHTPHAPMRQNLVLTSLSELVELPAVVGQHLALLGVGEIAAVPDLVDRPGEAVIPVRVVRRVDDLVLADQLQRLGQEPLVGLAREVDLARPYVIAWLLPVSSLRASCRSR